MDGTTRSDLEFCVLDVDHVMEGGVAAVRLWGRTADGKSVLVLDRGFKPYFYVDVNSNLLKKEGVEKLRERVLELNEMQGKTIELEPDEKRLLGEKRELLKVIIQNPSDIPILRQALEDIEGVKKVYEYDITFYRRYMVDTGISPMVWVSASGSERKEDGIDIMLEADTIKPAKDHDGFPHLKVMAFDIETLGDSVIMISYVSSGGKKGVLSYGWKPKEGMHAETMDNEESMLSRFFELVNEKDPDIIVTYNGDVFDFYRLRERADHYGIPVKIGRDGSALSYTKRGRIFSAKINGRVHIDLYEFVERIIGNSLTSETFSLDMVSKEILGMGKKEVSWEEMEKAWTEKKNLDMLCEYCLRDSELTFKLAERLLPQIYELAKLVGQTLFDTNRMSYSQLVEWFIIRHAFRGGEVILNRPKYDEIRRRREAAPYAGGYVYPPEPGIHMNLALFDFTSLYPSIIITHNISPETLDRGDKKEKDKVPGEEHHFSTEHKGFIPSIIEDLVRKRAAVKKSMKDEKPDTPEYTDLYSRQYALKILANAMYGYYAYAGSRWYSRICAKSIAAWGRYYIQKVIEYAKNRNLRVIYGDTDSLFLERCGKGKAKEFVSEVNDKLPETMELELVNSYKSGLFVHTKTGTTAKKRYALLDEDGNVIIRGFETVRRDWSKLAKDTQELVLGAILRDNDQNKAVNIVESVIERLKKGDVEMKDLVIYTQITRPLDEYDQIGPHVAAARKFAERGHAVMPGSVIGYVITRGEGTISNRAEPLEYAKDYDPEYYISNQIMPAAMRILNAIGLSGSEIDKSEDNESQKSLESFMKKSLGRKIKYKWSKKKDEE